jgi:LuxR family maltose regulon positive regulatory protein
MLQTKLHIPSALNTTVLRPGLYEKLNIGLNRKLILISAPAGYGKTTLVSEWINQHQIPTAWFSLDKSDNDPIQESNVFIKNLDKVLLSCYNHPISRLPSQLQAC